MRKILLFFCAIVELSNVKAQTTKEPSSTKGITINTLFYIKDKLAIEDADGYFLKLGYKFSGNKTNGDTVLYRYKKPKSEESFYYEIVSNRKISVYFANNSDAKSVALMQTVKLYGFKLTRNESENNKIYMEYKKGNLFVTETKFYNSDEGSPSFLITLRQLD